MRNPAATTTGCFALGAGQFRGHLAQQLTQRTDEMARLDDVGIGHDGHRVIRESSGGVTSNRPAMLRAGVSNQRTVELDHVHRKFVQVHQRVVTGAEIVQRHPHTPSLQAPDRRGTLIEITDRNGHGDLQHQLPWLNVVVFQRRGHRGI